MKDFWIEKKEKKINKKKLIILILLILVLVFGITVIILYNTVEDFHKWMDKSILNKEVFQDTSTSIELDDENAKVYAFDKNIGVLSKNKLKIYNNFGNKDKELDVDISNPIVCSSNRYVAIGEKLGQKLYVIEDKKIAWEAQIEGKISQIHINKNGYVAVVITGTTHKSVVNVFDNNGNSLFKIYRSSTRVVDVGISNDNKHLAIAEVDTTGTIIQASIKIISIEKAQVDSKNAMEKVYDAKYNSLIINIQYQDNNKLICKYDDSIHIIENETDEVLVDYNNEKISFTSISLNNNIVEVKEQSSGLFTADSIVRIINIGNKSEKTYVADAVSKEIHTYENVIALNLGSEIEFINTDGWLIKRYVAKQEITNIVVSSSVAAIVYRDKVEIINL